MEEYPEFVFTCDSVVYLAWIEESDPDLFEQIRARVAEGRFQVTIIIYVVTATKP